MATSSVGSSSGPRIGGDEIDVVSAVFDGNKVKIVVPFERTAGGRGNDDGVDEKKVRVEIPVPRRADHAQLLVQNHRNFKESGNPVMFMMYKDGSWVEFEKNDKDVLVSAFVNGKGMVEVDMEGRKFIFDFYRMIGNDLDSGNELRISWIDVSGRCFFPKTFNEGSVNVGKNEENVGENFSAENGKIELEIRIIEKNSAGEELGKRKRPENEEMEVEQEVSDSSKSVKQQDVVATPTELLLPKLPNTRSLREDESLYQKVKRLLLFVLRTDVIVTAVHEYIKTGPMEKARFEVFQENVGRVGRATGNPRVEYAWYGTSSKNVESILRRGFDVPKVVPGSHPHGVGIYLSPFCSPQNSALMSEVDEKGEKHIMMCRVILGNLEKVELGSEQWFGSSPGFDTGVDELINPKVYVVWCGNMNTHIIPEYIVSYQPGCNMPGRLNGDVYAYNALILLKIQSSLPLPTKLEFQALYRSYREGKVGKEFFLSQLRFLVGDELLHSIIQEIRG